MNCSMASGGFFLYLYTVNTKHLKTLLLGIEVSFYIYKYWSKNYFKLC